LLHIPVLQKEVLEYLNPKPNEDFIDCTFGMGGHSKSILEKIKPNGKVLGFEWDPELYKKISSESIERLILVNDSYTNLEKIVKEKNFGPVSGILFDLGMSSWHIEQSNRGFTFQKSENLDMRFNPSVQQITAEEILNQYTESEIEIILREYGEERFSKRISRAIIKNRPIKTTSQLRDIIIRSLPQKRPRTRINPATRVFQALRITVNQELENLEKSLLQALRVLKPNGRIVIICFHSLEERIVKNFFKANKNLLKSFTKKPIIPTIEEVRGNPRSRCAKLRASIKL